MVSRISLATLVVDDYDRAKSFYCDALGFECRSDVMLDDGKRWVVVAPAGAESGLLLARADGASQEETIGRQTGGRVSFFLETDDFARDHAGFLARGVRFEEPPRHEAYGTVAVFVDLYGNRWDLIEPRDAETQPAS
ncbi:extradiol dioxygenase [Rhizobium rhizosphaerae]|uniref:Extradiol dioxygenase n=1 Tax=Xaviernesmea rhizosphaerae TaxID=1672749 RepID=A0ABX3P9A1_9HYPH|nr:VOC family protein [Xaviernesmea rhizosphaerae]OQP84904.1 extradiol dioxygenase [Xaviernesmea rhizosphaerae]